MRKFDNILSLSKLPPAISAHYHDLYSDAIRVFPKSTCCDDAFGVHIYLCQNNEEIGHIEVAAMPAGWTALRDAPGLADGVYTGPEWCRLEIYSTNCSVHFWFSRAQAISHQNLAKTIDNTKRALGIK